MKTKLNCLIAALLLLAFCQTYAKSKTGSEETVIRAVADNILQNTTYTYINTDTGERINKLNSSNYTIDLNIESPYNEWKYWNGVLGLAMLELYKTLGEEKYRDFSTKNMEFIFNGINYFRKDFTQNKNPWHYPFGLLYRLEVLDDFGAEGATLVEVNKINKNKMYASYIDTLAQVITSNIVRLKDGTFARKLPEANTLWADDLYMSVPFLSRLGDFKNEENYFHEAVFQVKSFHNKLFSEKAELYYHCWYANSEKNGVAYWGRANGWVMMAKVDLLSYLPENYNSRNDILRLLTTQIDGIIKCQDESGLWHQLLDKKDSYLETSCSAMFTYAIAKAVNMGWIDKSYADIAKKGWEGIKTKINSDGQVKNICIGTGIGEDLEFYYNRPTIINDIHGLGAVILAGIEVMKLEPGVSLK